MLILALLLALAAPAGAATVAVRDSCDKSLCSYTAELVGAQGEPNAVTVTREASTVLVLQDTAAPLAAGRHCTLLDAHTARCTAPEYGLDVALDLGAGDDTATLAAGRAGGGPGNDRITGGNVLLTGGPGADVLTATVRGYFIDADGARPARDRYVGSADPDDRVSYQGRRSPVTIDLRSARAAEDELTAIDGALGGNGTDLLIGDDGPNALSGTGRDRLVGNGGDDTLVLNGDGTVGAGEGDDEILITSQGALARCGPGDDHADGVGDDDDVRDCERLNFSRADERDARFHVRGRAVLTNLDCDCRRARYVARFRDVIIAEARGRPRALRLDARGRALLAERGRLRITIRIRHEFEAVSNESAFRTVIRR